MKLPDSNLIKSDSDMKFLYEYDIKELFNPNKRSAKRFCYETKLNLVLDMVDKVKRRENVIDIGCAQGNYTLSIAAKGMYSIGIDLRRSFIKYAKMKTEKNEKANVDFLVANAEYLPLKSESANCIILGELLEHLSEPDKVLIEVKRVLKAGASFLIISTPNAERFRKTKTRTYTDTCLMPKNKLDKFKFGANTHVFEFTKEELLSLLSKNHYEILYFTYLWLVPPFSLLYKIPLPSRFIRRIETMLLNVPAIAQKLSSDMICVVTRSSFS